MTIKEYLAKADNVQLDNCAKLYVIKSGQTLYEKRGKYSRPTPAYFKARAYFKSIPAQSIINIWIYLSEVDKPVFLYNLEAESKEFVRKKQIEEEAKKQKELSTGNHAYNLEDFLND